MLSERDEGRRPPIAGDAEERAAGRVASAAELRRRLAAAPAAYLEGAAENPALAGAELLLLLRNRQAPPAVLQRIGSDKPSLRQSEVKRLLVLHPRTPLHISRSLVGHLFWRQLAEVTTTPHVHPVARRQAEIALAARLAELSEGERVSLARRVSRGLFQAIVETGSARELESLLQNPRAVEADAVRVVSRPAVTPVLLANLARSDRWGRRQSVRLALLSHPRTPAQAALGLLRGLARRDLRRLSRDPAVPQLVRIGAERLIEPHGAGPETPAGSRPSHA